MGKRDTPGLIAATFAAATFAGAVSAGCSIDTVSIRDDSGTVQFTVDVADTNEDRGRGLMFVEEMATMQGMLFVYERPQRASFWMRNTLIPLDMLFVDELGVVQNIHAMAQPLDETPIFGGEDIQFVLEINGGLAAMLGLEVEDQIQHPSFGSDAVWPCELNLLRLKSKGSVFLSACGARLISFPTEVGGFKPIGGKSIEHFRLFGLSNCAIRH